jgi:T-complex protein 1 subunit theta
MFGTTGLTPLLKEGVKHFSGLQEAILRNIEACKQLTQVTRTSLGPNGMCKMVIDQHDKLFVTSDAATIVKELDIVHPAAKMLVLASQMQEQEIGDGTNFVIVFGGELLQQAEALIHNGLHPADILSGFEKATKKALETLEGMTVKTIDDPRNMEQVTTALKSIISAKQFGYEDLLAPLIAQACIQILPKDAKNFNVDNVRVAKVLGGGVVDTTLVKGFVLARDSEGTIKHVTNAKVAIFVNGIDIPKPDNKATVLIKSAEQLKKFSKEEEQEMEGYIKGIAESGAKVLVSGANVSDIAMHFIERYKMMVVKSPSKFNLRRICKATGATPLVRLGAPMAEELGFADVVTVEEIGSTKCTIFRQEAEDSRISTLVVRAATHNILDDIERAIDDAVNAYKVLVRDGRLVAGGGATEIELSRKLQAAAEATPGLDQYAMRKYGEAFEVIPRTLAENAGLVPTEVISTLYAAHARGETASAVDIDGGGQPRSAVELGVFDSLLTKYWAIKYASEAAITVLRVDQIIMAKPAGGPKARPPRAADADEGDLGD